jgi:hypothetical protein
MSCNCRIFPFKPDPPCFDLCTGRLLNSIAERVLRHLNVPHIDKVIQFRRQQWIDDLKELSTVTIQGQVLFTPWEVDDIRRAFRNITPGQAQLLLP